jgi:hypothetical protein
VNGHAQGRRAGARRRREAGPALYLLATLGSAAALGMVLYVASTSLPFLATSPTTDPAFGHENQCLMQALAPPRVGYAVSWDGRVVAGYSGASLALCDLDGGARVYSVRGVQQAAWDAQGTLWLGTAQGLDAGFRLGFLGEDGGLESAGDFAAVALAGHGTGAVAVDEAGKVVSLTRDGEVLGWAQLPSRPVGPVQLSANADGSLAAAVLSGGLVAFRTADLSRVRAEAPCQVEFLWWMPRGDDAVVSCGPGFTLSLNVSSGEREAAARRERTRSALVPGRGLYAQSCEQLPCTAPPP